MERRLISRIGRTTMAAMVLTVAVGLSPGSASGGGWAVGSIDEQPTPEAGEDVEVGFTILQHGKTPAVLDRDVGIELRQEDGSSEFFVAVPSGEPGHYVATVSFPDEGTVNWTLMMGWFGPQSLGTITVEAPHTVTAGWWRWVQWSAIGVAGGLLLFAVAPVVSRRRQVALS
jgi:hypothetical protein